MASEQISALGFAGKTAGVEFESLERGLAILSKNVAGLGTDSKKTQAALASLGVSARDGAGHVLPLHDLLLKISNRFSQTGDGAEKTAIAMALFGRSGAEMIPLLNQGAAGIQALEERAKSLGIVLDSEATRAAAQFDDEIDALNAGLKGLNFAVFKHAFPALSLLVELFLGNKEAIRIFKDELELVALKIADIAAIIVDPFGFTDKAARVERQAVYDDMAEAYANFQKEMAALSKLGAGTEAFELPPVGKPAKTKAETFGLEKRDLEAWAKLVDELRPKVEGVEAAWRKYYDTLLDIAAVESAGFDVSAEHLRSKTILTDEATAALHKEADAIQEAIVAAGIPKELPFEWQALGPIFEKHQADLDILGERAYEFGREMSSAFSQMIIYGRGFRDMLESILAMLVKVVMETFVWKSLAGHFTKGSIFSKLFGGLAGIPSASLQGGGEFSAGQPVIVGERGPELAVFSRAGSIIPNDRLGGIVIENIDARGADGGVEYRVKRAVQAGIATAAVNGYRLTVEMAKRS
jgi:hypothetical protein